MHHGTNANIPPSAITSHSSPRAYDVGLLFCIRAVNLAWQEARRIPSADQALSQWLVQRVAFFHTVVDEGTHPRRSCPTDVEMQPLREMSSSVSPQRTSASLPHQPSMGGVSTFLQHSAVPDGYVDFTSIAAASQLGGNHHHNDHTVVEAFNISKISEVGVSPGGETVDQTPQLQTRHRPTAHLLPATGQRSGGAFGGGIKHRAPSYPPHGTAPRGSFRGHMTDERCYLGGGGGGASAYRYARSSAQHLGGSGDLGAAQWGDHARQALSNKGCRLVQELLLLCLDLSETLFCTMVEAFLAVLPRPSTTHAEITLAMFENYPYLVPASTNKKSVPPPDMILEAAENAIGNALKSFLVYMNISFNCGSFERQCEVLEMCKVWRSWMQQTFSAHVGHVMSGGGRQESNSPTRGFYPSSSGAHMLSPAVDDPQRNDAYINWTRSALCEALTEDSTVEVEQLLHEAMLAKDVSAVANTMHRYFEHRLGADGTGRALLEVLLDPSVPPPPATSPISFLFGVPPVSNRHTGAGGAPPPAAIDGGAPSTAAGPSASSAGASTEIHAAMSCGILTFGQFYFSLRSTKAAMRCAEMAVLNGHQAGSTVDTLALAHLLKSRCHAALGQLSAAAEDVSIALQLSLPPQHQHHQQMHSSLDWWMVRTMAFQAAAELLIYFPNAVDAALRGVMMPHPLLTSGSRGGAEGGNTAGNKSAPEEASGGPTNPRALEVIQTLAQSVVHAVWCATVAMMGDQDHHISDAQGSSGISFEVMSSITNDTLRVAATSLGVACCVAPVTYSSVEVILSQLQEDSLVLPLRNITCSVDSIILELSKLAFTQAIQQVLGEYAPPSNCTVGCSSATRSEGETASPLAPMEALLDYVQARNGNTDILDRCTHFVVAVDAVAAHVLVSGGFFTLAQIRLENALRRLLDRLGGKDAVTGIALPSLDEMQADAAHWPTESLLLLLLCTCTAVSILLFQGNVADAQRTVDNGLGIFTRYVFPRGILRCHVLQALVWQSRRERAAQVRCLRSARDSAINIGYLPLAGLAHLQLIGAHIAVEDFTAAAVAWNEPLWRQTLVHHVKCDPANRSVIELYRTVLQVLCHAPNRVLPQNMLSRIVKYYALGSSANVLPLQLRLSLCSSVFSLASVLRHNGVEADPLPPADHQRLQAVAAEAFTQLRARRFVDSWRGIGDSALETCACVREMLCANSSN